MIQKIEDNIFLQTEISSFLVCGDPGCDGYNTKNVVIFEEILRMQADLAVVLGDLVPVGTEKYFRQFIDIVNSNAKTPVFCVAGNHDVKEYDRFLGRKDYFIKAPNALLLIADNSRRYFTDATIQFIESTLRENAGDNVFVMFHIPPPNPFIQNNIAAEEWDKLKRATDEYKESIRLIFCGHVHSAFDYKIDGYRVIVTGGAGSRLDPIENTCLKANVHHTFKMVYKQGKWSPEITDIFFERTTPVYDKDGADREILEGLMAAFSGESQAHRKYLLYAEIAGNHGLRGMEKLFRALSESEFIHAKNMLIASNQLGNTKANTVSAIEREKEEFTQIYPAYLETSGTNSSKRAYTAISAAMEAERVHHAMLSDALDKLTDGMDIPVEKYHTCTRCGYTHRGERAPSICPACGTDMFKFTEVL
ncbi:MAG: metallophosphoesterase [Nitrospirae bacterium]|uniref:Rubrerythrin domain-containing protein n=1 Tax=Candidatus Magnetobacterium casense TaxID=1455061 RepID=A0A088F8M3_9BACT|nr:metallophosphoesterase [Candidatus Magnetobacterium casensis]AIM41286.1 rubrerythrin domain-containing protein [Candidatus Magnetobacterium casensis]MBF0337224.1 metallophosphoesterase [Nitrospirota bacterium]